MTDQKNLDPKSYSIIRFLEDSYTGAKAYGNEETMLRLSRALIAFQADVHEDIFLPEIIEKHIMQ